MLIVAELLRDRLNIVGDANLYYTITTVKRRTLNERGNNLDRCIRLYKPRDGSKMLYKYLK